MTDKDTSSRRFKGDYLYVKPKSLPRELIQKIFLKLLQILFPKKFLLYKDRIRSIMNKFRNYLFFISKNIYLRFKYPRYFTLPIQHIHSIDRLLIFLEILKPKKIDFFLLYGSLLGAIRQESFAGRPKDIDLGIKEDQLQKLLDEIPLIMKNKAVASIRCHGELSVQKLKRLQFLLHHSLIDVEVFRKKNEMWQGEPQKLYLIDEMYNRNFAGSVFPISDLENLLPIKVYGKKFLSPANPEIYLVQVYGKNWRIPNKKQFFWNKNKLK